MSAEDLAPSSTAWILRQALAILAADAPAASYRFSRALRDSTVRFQVGDERFTLTVHRDSPVVVPGWADAPEPVEVQTSRARILDLIDGSKSLLEAVTGRELFVTADADTLVRLGRALNSFTEGAVRSRRMRTLLAELRCDPVQPAGG